MFPPLESTPHASLPFTLPHDYNTTPSHIEVTIFTMHASMHWKLTPYKEKSKYTLRKASKIRTIQQRERTRGVPHGFPIHYQYTPALVMNKVQHQLLGLTWENTTFARHNCVGSSCSNFSGCG